MWVAAGIFLILMFVAGLLGFAGLIDVGAGIARLLFFVFLILMLASVLARGLARDLRLAEGLDGD